MSLCADGEAGTSAVSWPVPILMEWAVDRALLAFISFLTFGARPMTVNGARENVRACAQPVLIGSGRRLVSSVLAWRHVLGANYARERERCDPVRKLPAIPSHSIRRSALGSIRVYNLLPADVVLHKTVKQFQQAVSGLVKDRVVAGDSRWRNLLSPRHALFQYHPLVHPP